MGENYVIVAGSLPVGRFLLSFVLGEKYMAIPCLHEEFIFSNYTCLCSGRCRLLKELAMSSAACFHAQLYNFDICIPAENRSEIPWFKK